tara:strand:- start:2715 stop:3755 length:1041 start_codon:yes stop_codon:yes gene_type:complete
MADISGNLINNTDGIIEDTILDQDHLETENLSQQNTLNQVPSIHSSLTDNNPTNVINTQSIHSSQINSFIEQNKINTASDNYSDVSLTTHNDNIPKFDKFKYEFMSTRRNNIHILQESKESKRLLDLKYNDLVNIINNIQTSVIFTSTISGFLQATKEQFELGEIITSVVSITIATYISLVLSISKYYGLSELKERIQLLREKYSQLLNEIDYNMDILGPWSYKNRWRNSDQNKLYSEWIKIYIDVSKRYDNIVSTKKELVTEYEDIMDTKSRNYYDIQNKKLNLKNKEQMYSWEKAEEDLEQTIAQDKKNRAEAAKLKQLTIRRDSIKLGTEELDNWSFDDWNSV